MSRRCGNTVEDIPLLAMEFMRRLGRKHGVQVKGFTDAALSGVAQEHAWPGNVRELQNVVERAVIMCGENGMLGATHLGLTLSNQANQIQPSLAA
jgi:two-component system response regulator HydG